MRVIYAAILLLFAAAAVVFCLQNLGSVAINYLGWKAVIPLPLLVLVVYLLGMITGWGLLSFLRRSIRLATDAKKQKPSPGLRRRISVTNRESHDDPPCDVAPRHFCAEYQIQGLLQVPERETVLLSEDPMQYPKAIAQAMESLQSAALPGPYFVIFGRTPFFKLMQKGDCGYPPHRLIEEMTGGPMQSSPALAGGVVVSAASGHFELTIGQDWSIGYGSHDRDEVELYITESFTFRVLEPAAVVELAVAR